MNSFYSTDWTLAMVPVPLERSNLRHMSTRQAVIVFHHLICKSSNYKYHKAEQACICKLCNQLCIQHNMNICITRTKRIGNFAQEDVV